MCKVWHRGGLDQEEIVRDSRMWCPESPHDTLFVFIGYALCTLTHRAEFFSFCSCVHKVLPASNFAGLLAAGRVCDLTGKKANNGYTGKECPFLLF